MADLAGFRTYATDRGYPAAQLAADADALAALARANDYILLEYVANFAPGFDATAPNVDDAIYEAALSELDESGALRPRSFWNSIHMPGDKDLVAVGDIKWKVRDESGRIFPVSSLIESRMRPYMPKALPGIGIWAIG